MASVCFPMGLCGAEDEADRLQRAYIDGMTMQAEAFQAGDEAIAAEEPPRPPVPVRGLCPRPDGFTWHVRNDGWRLWAVLAAMAIAFAGADWASGVRAKLKTEAVRLRQAARRLLLDYVSGGDVPLDDMIQALRVHLGMPDGTSLTALADTLEGTDHDLAEACRRLEMQRFSPGGTVDDQPFRKALRRCLAVFAAGLTGCLAFTAEDSWTEAVVLAEQGRAEESLEAFLDISRHEPSSPELSRNIALLLSVMPSEAAEERAERSQGAWHLHATALQKTVSADVIGIWRAWLPELCLAAVMPLLAAAVMLKRHGFQRLSWSGVTAAVLVTCVFMQARKDRMELLNHAVAADGGVIRMAPSDDAPETEMLTQPVLLRLTGAWPETDGFSHVRSESKTGWIRNEFLICFKP